MTIEYVNPLDTGERYVTEYLSGSLWERASVRWAIVDRNTGELMRKAKDNQPHNKGKFIWRGDKTQARWWCDRLNDSCGGQVMDAGSGPDMQARRVDVGVIIGQARRARSTRLPTFVSCDQCRRCHRAGSCPAS